MFVIKNKKTGEYWSLSNGWCEKPSRTKFNDKTKIGDLPRFGEWEDDIQLPGFYVIYQGQRDHGKLILDPEKGIGSCVVIEAHGPDELAEIAGRIGLRPGYEEQDCQVCPPRWTIPTGDPGFLDRKSVRVNDIPLKFTKKAPAKSDYSGFVHFLNGLIKYFSND